MTTDKKTLTDFQIMDKMASENMDISMCPDLISADKAKQGGKLTFGVPSEAFYKVINSMAGSGEKYYVVVYIINQKQFEQIKNP